MASAKHKDEEPFETNDEICQKLVEEFVDLTKSDEACAQFYLQDRNWNLRLSVNDFFNDKSKTTKRKAEPIDVSSDDTSDDNECDIVFDLKKSEQTSGKEAALESNLVTVVKEFCLISWNINGIDEKNLRIRTEAVSKFIRSENALIVLLQEMVPQTEAILRQSLPEYEFFSGNNNCVDYYTMTAIHKTYVKLEANEIVEFRQTSMGRNLLKTKVRIGNALVSILNTHLESTKDFGEVRVKQLNQVFHQMTRVPNDQTVIFGGDLNVRDNEIGQTNGVPRGVYDVWIKTGARKEVEFTWDLLRNDNLQFTGGSKSFKPRFRFDRIYVRPSIGPKVDAIHFGLIGLERLKPYVCFPSDHWGLRVHFKIE